mmetsp:Transcript_87902/g.229321  ORF Transcript_87902/g.229321 Transcript_87902/m.229321 type:complete len:217 (+) Transcript_87902:1130-1780(+)
MFRASIASRSDRNVTKPLGAFTARAFSDSTFSTSPKRFACCTMGSSPSSRMRFRSARASVWSSSTSRSRCCTSVSRAAREASSFSCFLVIGRPPAPWGGRPPASAPLASTFSSTMATSIFVFAKRAFSSASLRSFRPSTRAFRCPVYLTTQACSTAPGKSIWKYSFRAWSEQCDSGTPSTSTVVERGGSRSSSHLKRTSWKERISEKSRCSAMATT